MRYSGYIVVAGLASAAIAAIPNPQAGQWLHQGRLVSTDIPGIPAFLAKSVAAPKPRSSCLTSQQSTSAPQTLFRVPEVTCSSRNFTVANGRISGTSTCEARRMKTPLSIVTVGTYTATSYNIRSETSGSRNGKPMKIVATGTGKWIGAACK